MTNSSNRALDGVQALGGQGSRHQEPAQARRAHVRTPAYVFLRAGQASLVFVSLEPILDTQWVLK